MPKRPTGPVAEVRLLGSPEIIVHGRPLEVDTRKAVAILAVLATDGRPYGREELATLLWPESDDAAARGALRRTLSVLRGAVGADVLHVDRRQVALDAAKVAVDVARIEQLGASGLAADLAEAAELARGPFMAGFTLRDSPEFDDWRAARAVAVERTVGRVLEGLTDALDAQGDQEGAIAAAGRRIDHDPLDEASHVRRMELLAAAGDRAGAVRQYRACVAILERELGVDPLPETTARYEAIRDGAPSRSARVSATSVATGLVSDALPAIDPGRIPLVGRDEAIRRARAARAAIAGGGTVLVIRGEPGIGKSRLAARIAEEARAEGAAVLGTAAYAAEQGIAYGPVADALEQALRDSGMAARIRGLGEERIAEVARIVPGVVSPARRTSASPNRRPVQARLLASIADALTAALAGPTPGMLIVDDIQWADRATIATLAYLLRRLDGRPILIVLAWRDEDLTPDGRALADLALARGPVSDLRLTRLERAQVETLIGLTDPGGRWSREALWVASEGLPLYLASALATGPDLTEGTTPALPAGVRAVLSERLGAVDGVAAQVLAAAAVIGRAFEVPTLRYASGRTEDELVDALDALAARGLIRETALADGSPVFDFTHAALRDLSQESTSLARRRLLHRRVAEALRFERAGVARDDPGRLGRIARHELAAGRDSEAATAFREAGDAAARVYANNEAIESYAAALGLGHPDVVDLHVAIGRLRTRVGDYPGAVHAYEAAAAVAEPATLSEIEAALALTHLRAGDPVSADAHVEAALAGSTDPAQRASSLVDRAVIRRRLGDRAGAERAAIEAAAAAERAGDVRVTGAARRIVGLTALDAGALSVAVRHLEAAVVLAKEDPDPSASIAALTGLAMALAAAGDVDGALDRGSEAVAICRRIGDRHAEGAVENHLADLLHAAGRGDESFDHLRRSVEAFTEISGRPDELDPGIWMLE